MSLFFKRTVPFFLVLLVSTLIPATAYSKSSRRAEKATPFADVKQKSAPVQIKGDTVEYFQEDQKAVGTGHVTIDYEGTNLAADKITVYTATKNAVAEGNVVLTEKGSTFKGARAEYDFDKKVGHVDKMDANFENSYFGKAQSVERVSVNHYRVTDAYVTTCCGDDPFYKISSHTIDYYPDDKIVIRNALLFIKGIPVLFIPYYEQPFVDFDRFPVHVAVGSGSDWGPFLLSRWRYNLVHREDLKVKGNVLLDYRAKRGFGGGAEVYYQGDKVGRGSLRGYYANDNKPPQDENPNRDRYQWRHQSKLGEATTLTSEWNRLSDPEVVKDFFYHEEYEADAQPDNYVSIITATPDYTLSLLDRERVNDFYTVTERSPQIRFDTHNHAFGQTPFYLRQEFQFDNLKKQEAKADTSLDQTRFDERTTLSYAARVGDFSVTPRAAVRQTYFRRDAAGDRDLLRGVFEPGLDISTHFFKTYGAYWRAWGLDVNQLRHVFTPTFSYNYRPNPTVNRTLLQQFDALDAVDKDNYIRLNFENKFLTKSRDKEGNVDLSSSREFARVMPYLDVDEHTGRLENVGIESGFRPYTWMGIESDATYDPDSRDWDTANFDIYFEKGRWRVAVGQRYVRNDSSQSTFDLRFKMNDQWAFKLYERYEFVEGASKEFEFTVSRSFDCVIADFTYNRREGDTFFVSLRLKDFPSTPYNLNQSYNPPKVVAPERR